MATIQKIKIAGYDNEPVKYKKEEYPKPKPDSGLPYPYYVAVLIGSTGTGKTEAVVKLLKYAEKEKYYNKNGDVVPQRIWIFAPTIQANQIYFTLDNLDPNDVITEYTDAALKTVIDEIRSIKEESEKYQEDLELWKQFQKARSLKRFTPEQIMTLDAINYEEPIKPKYPIAPINHMIMDDLLCVKGAFKSVGASGLSNLCVKCRHESCCVYILAQSSQQVPKVIRTQARLLMLYRFNSKKLVEDLYDIVSSILTPEEFQSIYDQATEEKYNYLLVDNTGPNLLFKQNLNFLIKISRKKTKVKNDNKNITL